MNIQGKPLIGASSLATTLLLGMTGTAIATPPVVPIPQSTAIQISQVGAMVLYVNGTSGQDSPTAGKAEASPLKTITYALQQAQPGTTIQVSPGTYSAASGEVFPLILKPGISLRGDEATKGQTTTINGGGQVNTVSLARQNITIFAMQDSAIRGLSVTNPLSRGTGVWVESTNPTIANNTFANSQREGIFMLNYSAQLANNTRQRIIASHVFNLWPRLLSAESEYVPTDLLLDRILRLNPPYTALPLVLIEVALLRLIKHPMVILVFASPKRLVQ